MSLADELAKLEALRRSGALSDTEFAQAKKTLISGGGSTPAGGAAPVDRLGEQLAEVRYQNELERIDREWDIEREKYMITGRYGQRHIPTPGEGIGGAIVIGVFGVFWTIMAFAITSGGPDEGPFEIAKIFFPLFGVVFTIFGIYHGIHAYGKAEAYKRAQANYQRRRAAVRPEDFR